MKKTLIVLVVACAFLSSRRAVSCDDKPKPGTKTVTKVIVRHRTITKYDTTHIPFIVLDTVHVAQYAQAPTAIREEPAAVESPQKEIEPKQPTNLFVSYNSYSYSYQPVTLPPPQPATPQIPTPETANHYEAPLTTEFHPFLTAGLHAEPHYPATWSAGIGIDLSHGGFEIECAATIEPQIPDPVATTYGEQQALQNIDRRIKITTVIYGAIRYLF